VKEEAEETLGQLRARQALALAHGPVRVDCHIKVEDCTSGEDTDGDGEGEEEGPAGEVGLVLLAAAAHVPADDGERGGGLRRSIPADRAARAKRGRGDNAADDAVPDAPPMKRISGGAQVGKSGRHGVHELIICKATPWLKWRALLSMPGNKLLELGNFPTVDDAARAYDAEVRRRGWAHVKPLNFPQPEERAAYAQAEQRCDERGLPLSLAPKPSVTTHGFDATLGASGRRLSDLSAQKPGKSGFFGVSKSGENNKATPWRAQMNVPAQRKSYVVGRFANKEEAAQAYDTEVRRRGWTHLKRVNFPDPADDAALPPSSAPAGAPGPD